MVGLVSLNYIFIKILEILLQFSQILPHILYWNKRWMSVVLWSGWCYCVGCIGDKTSELQPEAATTAAILQFEFMSTEPCVARKNITTEKKCNCLPKQNVYVGLTGLGV